MKDYAIKYLNKPVVVKIDRPLGSQHPKFNYHYDVNYGFVSQTVAPDGEAVDAYVLGVAEPISEFTGNCIAVIHRLDDDDDKLVVVSPGVELADVEIMAQVNFQEKYFTSEIIRNN
ncbi:MAG: inorganic diphosphatase [Patescibacteria group bacterium]|nr:inorganic diphosphatase [Patescibacteria group bacterium]